MRVGLRCLPFRKAPIPRTAPDNEQVWTYEGQDEVGLAHAAIPTDSRVFLYEGVQNGVVGASTPFSDIAYTYEGSQNAVIEAGATNTATTVQLTFDLSELTHDMFAHRIGGRALIDGFYYDMEQGRAEGAEVGPGEVSVPVMYGTLGPKSTVVVLAEWQTPLWAFPNKGYVNWNTISATPVTDALCTTTVEQVRHPLGVMVTRPVLTFYRAYSTSLAGQRLDSYIHGGLALSWMPLNDDQLELQVRRAFNSASAQGLCGMNRDWLIGTWGGRWGDSAHDAPPCGAGFLLPRASYLADGVRHVEGRVGKHPVLNGRLGITAMGVTVWRNLNSFWSVTALDEYYNPIVTTKADAVAELQGALNAIPGVAEAGGVTIDILEFSYDGGFKFRYR